jgi:CMP-2-keto-3-deoxyoctulosonic acid synthetase
MEYEKFDSKELVINLQDEDIRFITEKVIQQFRQKLKENNQKIITS